MFRPVTTAVLIAIAASGAVVDGPSYFYAVSVSFSDNGAQFYYRILDATQDGPDTVVRYIRIAPTNVYCPRMMVQAAETRIRNQSPAKLVAGNNPCAVKPEALRASLDRYRRADGVFEAISFGIVARCGQSSVTLDLPISQQVDLTKLSKVHPEIARLWDLTSTVTVRAFGEIDVFHDRRDEEDAALQNAGEKMVPDLISGRYDSGLAVAVKGNVGTWKSPSFRSLLRDYHGPISAADAKASYVPQLLDSQSYRFTQFVPPKFPPLALMARIHGNVEVQLNVEPATGEVKDVTVLSGHPLLKPSAIDVVKQWRFVPNSVPTDTLRITLEYALRCP